MDRKQRIEEIVLRALELAREEREAFAREQCDEETLLMEVLSELRAEASVEDGLLGESEGPASVAAASPILERIRRRAADAQRYVRKGEVGQGGMGSILLAEDPTLRRELAMKMIRLREDRPVESGTIDRFVEEAQLTAQLAHPGVVPVHELGLDSEGQVYFTMARIRGEDLKHVYPKVWSEQDGWNLTRAVGVLQRVCETMAYAHAKGVIHRDLKPANVMVGSFGEVYVMDWGIAKVVKAETGDANLTPVRTDRETEGLSDSSTNTVEGAVMGTPSYMSPEQALGKIGELDERSDVYAIGAMLYALLTGYEPYDSPRRTPSAVEVVLARRNGPPPPIESLVGEASEELVAICEKAMATDPAARYADTSEMGNDLRAYLENRVVRAHRTGAWIEFKKWVQRNRGMAAALLGLVLAVVSGLGGMNVVNAQKKQVAERGRQRVLRLSDTKVEKRLRGELDELWPAVPERVDALRTWLENAEGLLSRRSVHEEALAALEAELEPRRDDDAGSGRPERIDWTDPRMQEEWQKEVLAEHLESLESFAPLVEAFRRERLEFAETVEERTRTGDEARVRWSEAAAAIRASENYGGLELEPQLGLLPLWEDPDSGMWEFWVVQSGDEPERGDDGAVRITETVGIVMILLPGGETTIGSNHVEEPEGIPYAMRLDPGDRDETPAHTVRLDPFFVSKYEMTQGQWRGVMASNPSVYSKDNYPQYFDDTHPVENLSWFEARDAMRRLCLSILTEAQWEYAARAGTHTAFSTGPDVESLQGYANLADASLKEKDPNLQWFEASIEDGYLYHATVGSFLPNRFGLHDVHGNVWSWTLDSHYPYSQPDTFHESGTGLWGGLNLEHRGSMRGGSWNAHGPSVRSAVRFAWPRENRSNDVGIRPGRALDPAR